MRPHDLTTADAAWAACVLLHPHPDMGGDRHNNVVSALYDALPAAGVSALRFDFSSSAFAVARGETTEALELLASAPRYVVGYSFGGGVASLLDDALVDGWALVAPALSMVTPAIGPDPRPKLVIAAAHDQFFPPDALASATAGWIATEHEVVTSADHFFGGRTGVVVDHVLAWLRRVAR